MPSRLKSLEMNGYKTFATRTTFEFASTVTAIVGPNGSGKSNIADALRWVLGEQSYSLLRGRKTVDMIFSGSEHRSRAGMASATILFDNSDEWLPIDYSEVSITRRAYRDGQNEYLVNGQRVRLRDVSELLARSGLAERTYTIIGQGLVDVALSLRAEERRRLFEEAAGIGLYRSRREEALRRLETTRRNMERVQDILAELKPRLRSLERQARRAREYDQVKSDLREVLREWYGFHWHRAQQEVIQAQETARLREADLETARQVQTQLDQQLAGYTTGLHSLRARLNTWHREQAELHTRREGLSRHLAVLSERERALTQQVQDLQLDQDRQSEELADRDRRLEEASAQVANRLAANEEARAQAETERTRLKEQQGRREELEAALDAIRGRVETLRSQHAAAQARLAELQARGERQQELRSAAAQAIDRAEKALEEAAAKENAARKTLEEHSAARSQADSREQAIRQQLVKVEQELKGLAETQSGFQAEAARLGARYEVLEQAERALVGYESGARQLLEAARERRLRGSLGALRDQLEVPAELEIAISAALGEFVDAVLVGPEGDLDQALGLLHAQPAKAALLVINRLVPAEPLAAPSAADCLGVGSRLVQCAPELRPVVEVLLGQVLIVRDLAAAKRLIAGTPQGVRAVTLQGEVLHAEGPVLFRPEVESPKLSRPRQKRQVQSDLAQATGQIEAAAARLEALRGRRERLSQEHDAAAEQAREAQKEEGSAREAARQAQAGLDQARRQLEWERSQSASLEDDLQQAEAEKQALKQDGERLESEIEREAEGLRGASQDLASLSLDDLQSQLSHWELQAAVSERALLEARQRESEQQSGRARLQMRLETTQERLSGIAAELEGLASEKLSGRDAERQIAQQIETLNRQIQPAEAELDRVEIDHEEFLVKEVRSRQSLSQVERFHTQAQIALARQQESLSTLRRRIEDDFGLVAFEYEDEISGATPLPLEGLVEQLPRVTSLSPDIEDSLRRKKTHLRRMGAINPEAEMEYQEVKERFEFLTNQTEDLEKAEADVLKVIAELEALMEQAFLSTYHAVAGEFSQIFTRLFGGGAARLALTDPEDLTSSGIDIEARLPGRREQGLSLLSGGERSLTATALIFALLKISPTPFCVLDEVDAMLDEANVGRFRELLRELSADTQFILITHNRNTVQAADVIYGVTMGLDSASQVLSLKLDEVDGVYAA